MRGASAKSEEAAETPNDTVHENGAASGMNYCALIDCRTTKSRKVEICGCGQSFCARYCNSQYKCYCSTCFIGVL
jgi:hypothetical protein